MSRFLRGLWLVGVLAAGTSLAEPFSVVRPDVDDHLPSIPVEDILRAEQKAWNRDYNNFVDASDMCFDRAVDVVGEVGEVEAGKPNPAPLHEGSHWNLRHSNVAKMFLAFPTPFAMQKPDGSRGTSSRWLYHIATAVRGDDGEWHPIDPDRTGKSPENPEAWIRRHAVDSWGRALTPSRVSVEQLFSDLPPRGEVYFYWLPADHYQPVYDSARTTLIQMAGRDPIRGRALSVAALRFYRQQMLAHYPGAKLAGPDLGRRILAGLPWDAIELARAAREVVREMRWPGTPASAEIPKPRQP